MPGIIFRIPCSGPIRRSILYAFRKSSKVNWPAARRFSISACSSSSTAASARSISVSTSPMPRMREAIRSGWNTSSASTFSPVDANLIGLPVIAFTDSAAPPRASPSSFVRMTPSKAMRSSNACATFTASWPVIASSTSRMLCGLRLVADARQLVHQLFVDLQAAGRVDDHRVEPVGARALEAAPRRLDRILRVGPEHGHLDLRCRAARAGRSRPGAAGRRR